MGRGGGGEGGRGPTSNGPGGTKKVGGIQIYHDSIYMHGTAQRSYSLASHTYNVIYIVIYPFSLQLGGVVREIRYNVMFTYYTAHALYVIYIIVYIAQCHALYIMYTRTMWRTSACVKWLFKFHKK